MNYIDWLKNTKGRKMILTDRLSKGNRLIKKCNIEQEADTWQVSCKTLLQIAEELMQAWNAFSDNEQVLRLIEPQACAYKLDELIKNGCCQFIPKECFCIQTTEVVLNSINQIRMNGQTEEFIQSKEAKVLAVKNLIDSYEKRLEAEGIADEVMLLKIACNILDDIQVNNVSISKYLTWCRELQLAFLEDVEFTLLEQNFLEKFLAAADISAEKLEFLYKEEERAVAYRFFRAYGPVNEVRFVIDDLLKNNRHYDEVNLFYTSPYYEMFIKSGFERRGIPVVFSTGEYASETLPVQLLLSLLAFAKEDYLYKSLNNVMENPLLTFDKISEKDGKALSNPQICYRHFLRKGIGWGKERYIACIERENANESSKEKYAYFLKFLKDLIGVFEEETSCGRLYDKLLQFAGKYTTHIGKKNNQVFTALKESAPIIHEIENQNNLEACIEILSEYLSRMTIKLSCEEGAVVHAHKIQNADVLDRPYQYVIGLSAKQFQSDTVESPVLSDRELLQYIKGTPLLASENGKRLREDFENTMRTFEKGEIIMGYSTYDTIELKESSPSVLYLDYLEKYGSGKTEADISYQIPKTGLIIKEAMAEPSDAAEEQKDQVKKAEISMSSSALQALIKCPLRYHYQYEEQVQPMEYQEKNGANWLNPANKGNLFHRILERYCEQLFGCDEAAKKTENQALFEKIYSEVICELLEEQAYVSYEIYEKEKAEYKEQIWNYIQELHEEFRTDEAAGKSWRILGCECNFEDVSYPVPASEEENQVEILFKGSIDRLDAYLDKDNILYLRVLDYKTGKKEKLKKAIKKEEQIQHFVYALAAKAYVEKHKDEIAKIFATDNFESVVEEAVYVFPYEISNDKKLSFMTEKLQKGLPEKVNLTLQKVFDSGDYDKEEVDCKYCTFKRLCRNRLGTEW